MYIYLHLIMNHTNVLKHAAAVTANENGVFANI